ncbi:uncharacterized protein METZ01_LOCUS227594, partial [marine metagenome]
VVPDYKKKRRCCTVTISGCVYCVFHGSNTYCFPGRPAYAEHAAEKVWDIVFDLFERKLKK